MKTSTVATPFRYLCQSILVCFAIIVVGAAGILTVGQTKKWAGHTDLEVQFVVTDAITGKPIPNASVCMRADASELSEVARSKKIHVTTNSKGEAKRLFRDLMSFGSRGLFEDEFAVHLPPESFQATATGYTDTREESLNQRIYVQSVLRGENAARLVVPIAMMRDTVHRDLETTRE